MDGLRRYGITYPGDTGEIEDTTHCIVETEKGRQCHRKRGHGRVGRLCGQHAGMQAKGDPLVIPSLPVDMP